jgi:N,N'-diacetyllegionaminate synthase
MTAAAQPMTFEGSCLVMAEIGQAHDGSLGQAHAYIDAAAAAGAHAVKFQTHIAAAESTLREPWRVKFSRQDETRMDYWRRMEFTAEQWLGLAEHARERGLLFLSSPFSVQAVELLARVGVSAWKIPSGDVANTILLEAVLGHGGAPVLLSSGASTLAELDAAVERVKQARVGLAVMQCTSMYPTPPEHWGLNLLDELRQRYGCPVGLSDHSASIFAGVAAAALGAKVIEVHVTFHRGCFGPDTPASVTMDELAQLVKGVDMVSRSLAHPIDKDAKAIELAPIRAMFTRSLVASRGLAAGTVLAAGDLVPKKPAGGLPPARLPDLLGRRLARALAADDAITDDDLAGQ